MQQLMRDAGIYYVRYMDDFLILARSFQEAVTHTEKVIQLLQKLGFHINWKKSSPQPSRRLEYLGVIIDLAEMSFSLPEEKILSKNSDKSGYN